jgi:hypothetical protein
MKTISIPIEDQLDAALEIVAAKQGRDKVQMVADLVRKFVAEEGLKTDLQNPALAKLYPELKAEDIALAEEGIADYQQTLTRADQA